MGARHSLEFKYSVEVAPATTDNRSGTRRGATHPDDLVAGFNHIELHNSWDLFQMGLSESPNGKCVGRRIRQTDGTLSQGFEWTTYKEVESQAISLGTALVDMKLVEEKSFPDELYPGARNMRMLGIFAKNRVEWFITEQAANAFGMTLVPLYDTLGDDAIKFVLSETSMETVACSLEAALSVAKCVIESKCKTMENIILFDPVTDELTSLCATASIAIHDFYTLIKTPPKPVTPAARDDVATLCFTSGTTGNPKGVILSQSNFVATICACLRGPMGASKGIEVSNNDVHISYLPLAHVFERAICNVIIAKGAAIGVFSGDTTKLLDDVRALQPTVFISVPRLFNRINDRVFGGLRDRSAMAQFLFNSGMATKLKNLHQEGAVTHSLWDRLVFNKTRQLMGGNLRYMLSGGAPLDAVVQDRMKVLFCCSLMEGYGLSETLGTSFLMSPFDNVSGHVGGPLPCLEFCLESVNEMDYDATKDPPRGELLLRGPSVGHGYFRRPDETAKAFAADGWFHTGDIVILLPNGAIKIIDRRKNIFKLAQGEYIAPEKIESIYQQSLMISQVFAFGYSSKFVLVGIVVPDEDEAMRWAAQNNMAGTSFTELCSNCDAFKAAIKAEMESVAKEGGLKGYEKVKEFVLSEEGFTCENDLLTPTFKLKRHQAKLKFEADIDRMYEILEKNK